MPYRWGRPWRPKDRRFPGIERPSWGAPGTAPGEGTWPAYKLAIPAIAPNRPQSGGRRNVYLTPPPRYPRLRGCLLIGLALAARSRLKPTSRNASGQPSRWPLTRPIPVQRSWWTPSRLTLVRLLAFGIGAGRHGSAERLIVESGKPDDI